MGEEGRPALAEDGTAIWVNPLPHAHRHQDLQGAVQDFHVAVLQNAADTRHQGLATGGLEAGHWLLSLTAGAMLTPPGVVPGEVECQELAVLGERGWDQVSTRDTTSPHSPQPGEGSLMAGAQGVPGQERQEGSIALPGLAPQGGIPACTPLLGLVFLLPGPQPLLSFQVLPRF